ncbi:sulfotransferase family protein [Pseudoxanthomonas yeongjuensis]|uniref:tetratricopeptide repeat-containing sulfotransferase family protein n=1 Tax=Pseudoxanthomonas yeongjuensis TaxID=377616 RepID=UPI001391D613|nr:sulfotransferase [Pseudoxanthomonas yeongjuensis]KAF1718266.1 sulfotransferase family protein [Pseudoxanthomonas yeongjuensis]
MGPKTDPAQKQRLAQLIATAEKHATTGEFARAIDCYGAALTLDPDDANLLLQLSYMHSLSGHYVEAHAYALRAHAAAPKSEPVIKELIARLRTFNEIPALLECIERMLPLSRIPVPLLLAFAAQLSYVNLPGRAIEFLDEARRADPDYPATLLSRAQVLIYLGRFAEAEQDAVHALKRAPELAQGYWLLAQVRKQTPGSNHVQRIVSRLEAPMRSAEEPALLGFALHKELDDLGQYPEAWLALRKGCASKRSTLRYDTGATSRLFAALRDGESAADNAAPVGGTKETVPVFIVGMHRSGTTLLEQLLDGHHDVHGLGELYDFTSAMRHATDHHCPGVIDPVIVERATRADFPAVGKRYLDGIAWRLGSGRFFTDKLPSNFLNIGFICRALPGAKILHMVRDPMETCFSNLRELFSTANPYSYDLQELADYFLEYQRLMKHWHARYPGRILDVDYAQLTADPETQLRRVAAFCGFDFEPAMLDLQSSQRGIVTASAVQVRGGIRVEGTPKWRAYAPYLKPLMGRLGAS